MSAPAWVLKPAERCDRCGPASQAFVRARIEVEVEPGIVGPVDLHFCGHHFAKHEAAIRAVASEIVDERAKINLRPTPVAAVTPRRRPGRPPGNLARH